MTSSLCLLIFYDVLFRLTQVVYPKSDQQRHRLSEAVKNIFLFRPLDQVNLVFIFLSLSLSRFSPPSFLPLSFLYSSFFFFLSSLLLSVAFHLTFQFHSFMLGSSAGKCWMNRDLAIYQSQPSSRYYSYRMYDWWNLMGKIDSISASSVYFLRCSIN